jgi:hypothetical protein
MQTKRPKKFALCGASLLLILGQYVLAQEDTLRADVEAVIRSLYDGDIETALRYAHSELVEDNGGPAAFRQLVERTIQEISESGMEFESLSFPEDPSFYEGSGRRFAVVPTLLVVTANGRRIESRNFQLGILENQSDGWKFMEGARFASIKATNPQQLFADFPANVEFPPLSAGQVQ